MVDRSDDELLRECRAGDRRAFEQLVEKYQKTVFNIALRMVRDSEDAEDIAQAAFIRVYRKLDTFNPELKFFSWLYRIVVNESLNFLRQRRRHETLDERSTAEADQAAVEGMPGDEEPGEETEQKIQSGLMELSVEYRAVVVLRHFQEMSYAEIAEALSLSPGTVMSRLFRARERLARALGPYLGRAAERRKAGAS